MRWPGGMVPCQYVGALACGRPCGSVPPLGSPFPCSCHRVAGRGAVGGGGDKAVSWVRGTRGGVGGGEVAAIPAWDPACASSLPFCRLCHPLRPSHPVSQRLHLLLCPCRRCWRPSPRASRWRPPRHPPRLTQSAAACASPRSGTPASAARCRRWWPRTQPRTQRRRSSTSSDRMRRRRRAAAAAPPDPAPRLLALCLVLRSVCSIACSAACIALYCLDIAPQMHSAIESVSCLMHDKSKGRRGAGYHARRATQQGVAGSHHPSLLLAALHCNPGNQAHFVYLQWRCRAQRMLHRTCGLASWLPVRPLLARDLQFDNQRLQGSRVAQ